MSPPSRWCCAWSRPSCSMRRVGRPAPRPGAMWTGSLAPRSRLLRRNLCESPGVPLERLKRWAPYTDIFCLGGPDEDDKARADHRRQRRVVLFRRCEQVGHAPLQHHAHDGHLWPPLSRPGGRDRGAVVTPDGRQHGGAHRHRHGARRRGRQDPPPAVPPACGARKGAIRRGRARRKVGRSWGQSRS